MNGTHHSLFGHTGQSGLGDTGPLFGDTFPEHALAPAAGAALLGVAPPGSKAAEVKSIRAQVNAARAREDPTEDDGDFPDYDFKPVTYLVNCHTGDRLGAATDAKVWVELHGETGVTGKFPLEKPSDDVPFKRGGRDRFKLEWPDLGRLRQIRLGHRSASTSSCRAFG